MVNNNHFLLTKYLHMTNDIMVFAWEWAKYVSSFAVFSGYDYTELHGGGGEGPNVGAFISRAEFEAALTLKDPLFFHGLGHGNVNVFTGGVDWSSGNGTWSFLLKADENPVDCAGRITYLMSCDTAVMLGPAIISAGGLAFTGYAYPYGTIALNLALGGIDKVKYERWGWGAMDQTNLIANGILRGLTVSEATVKALDRCNAWINYFSVSGETYADWQIGALASNRDGLTNLGNINAKLIPPVIATKHTRATYAIGYTGLIAGSGETFILNIGCTCQVDNCDFTGKKFTVKNIATGAIYNGVFTHSDRGLNWGSIQLVAGDVGTEEVYEIRVETDSLHDETIGAALVFPIQYIFSIEAFDESTLNPIVSAPIQVNNTAGILSDQGEFDLLAHVTQAHVIINANGYESIDTEITDLGKSFIEIRRIYMRRLERTAKVKGYVKTRNGTPISGAYVYVGASAINLGGELPHTNFLAITDDTGYFEMPDFMAKDRYGVLIIKSAMRNDNSVTIYEPYVGGIDALADGDNVFTFNLDEAPSYDSSLYQVYVAGIVRDAWVGCIVPNVDLTMYSPSYADPWTVTMKTNDFGMYIAKLTHTLPSRASIFTGVIRKSTPTFLPTPPVDNGGGNPIPNYMGGGVFMLSAPWWGHNDYCFNNSCTLDYNSFIPMFFLFSGIVRDTTTLASIPNAKVSVVGKDDGGRSIQYPDYLCQTTTSETGFFELTVLRESTYQWADEDPGYVFDIVVESSNRKYSKEKLVAYLAVGCRFDIKLGFVPPPPPPPGKGTLEVHTLENSNEVNAGVSVTNIGVYTTPFSINLDPGNYILIISYKGIIKIDTVKIVADSITKVTYNYTTGHGNALTVAGIIIATITGIVVVVREVSKR